MCAWGYLLLISRFQRDYFQDFRDFKISAWFPVTCLRWECMRKQLMRITAANIIAECKVCVEM